MSIATPVLDLAFLPVLRLGEASTWDDIHGALAEARDRRGMPDADVFDIRRTERRSIGFGAGIHFCLGVNLARAELEEAIRGLATRTSSVELGAEPELIPFRPVRQFKELPLNVTPA